MITCEYTNLASDFVKWPSTDPMYTYYWNTRTALDNAGTAYQYDSWTIGGVVKGYYLEFRDTSGRWTILWTHDAVAMSGLASWTVDSNGADDEAQLDQWWTDTGARTRY
jgi:hypothetical protein